MSNKPELISFKLCPFVQRSVITLLEKKVDFDITYIDLQNKPEWFLEISPFGKVPVLKVEGTVLFESAVISEYLDETNPPSLHPDSSLKRAHHRAWIEFGSALLFTQYALSNATDQETFQEKQDKFLKDCARVEAQIQDGPFFGEDFSLVDTAYAPLWMRQNYLEEIKPSSLWEKCPKIRKWSNALLQRESVQKSIVPELKQLFINALREKEAFILQ